MGQLNQQTYILPDHLGAAVNYTLREWQSGGKVRRLWERDSTLWSGRDEHNWLGWLRIAQTQAANTRHLTDLAADVKAGGFTHAMLLGMGGSSLCPEVLWMTFGSVEGFPEFRVLDSTDPAQVRRVEERVDLAKCLFLVASKSGSTLEPTIFKRHFFQRVQDAVGAGQAGNHFIAITDPGSQLEAEASRDCFRYTFMGVPEIGGRFSALSNFGMVPAAVMGIDTVRFLESAKLMVEACSDTLAIANPGVVLGAILGQCARNGHNKLTIIASAGIRSLGAWLEQLLAESTGKQGTAIIPVDDEPLGKTDVYGDDRVFAYLRLATEPNEAEDAAVKKLEQAGRPVVTILVNDIYDLGQEFFRWEIATAVAGSIMGVNPFNQPDVQFSKAETKKLTDAYEQTGQFPPETPLLEQGGVKLFADPVNASALRALAGGQQSLAGYLRAHLNRISNRDYFALLAYLDRNSSNQRVLQAIRATIRDNKRVATCLGFGPRFLHSTGQAYKAGPNVGVFVQITGDDAADIGVPGRKYTFGAVKAAQARGDFQVLSDRARRALRVHLGRDITAGLTTLKAAVEEALS